MKHPYVLAPELILDNRVSLLLPIPVWDMPEEQVTIIYPMENRPDLVKVFGNEECWFSFRMAEEPLKYGEIEERLVQLLWSLKMAAPGMHISDVMPVAPMFGNKPVYYFTVCSMGLTSETYQFMYLLPIKGNTMIGTSCCDCKDAAVWDDIFKKIAASIRDLTNTWEYRVDHKNLLVKAGKYYESSTGETDSR